MLSRLLLLLVLFAPALAQAGWEIRRSTDAMTDETRVSAQITTRDGHTFALYRRADRSVWAYLAVPERIGNLLTATRRPIYRVDKLAADDLDGTKRLEELTGKQHFLGNARGVTWLVWHGEGRPDKGTLRDIMDGKQLLVRYFVIADRSREVRFDLSGARPVIAKALGVPAIAGPE